MPEVNNIKYCVYCGEIKYKTICDDCFFIKNKRKKKRFCTICGRQMDKTGFTCKKCIILRYRSRISLGMLIRREKKNKVCVFQMGWVCTNKNLSFQGHKFRCDFKPRTDCSHFRAKYKEIEKFLKKMEKYGSRK